MARIDECAVDVVVVCAVVYAIKKRKKETIECECLQLVDISDVTI